MEEIPLTRAYLESLATADLVKMADGFGLDIPDNPDRVFLIEELLEAASQDEDESPPEPEATDPVITEAAPLPRNYNIAFIEVMIRDPLWAFVFWEIKASDAEQFEKASDFAGYYLKVSPLESPGGVFTIPVKSGDTARYLALASEDGGSSWAEQGQYKVELCASLGNLETVLAVSSPLRLPAPPARPAGKEELSALSGNHLARLSGYGSFHILQRNERNLRAKRGVGAESNE